MGGLMMEPVFDCMLQILKTLNHAEITNGPIKEARLAEDVRRILQVDREERLSFAIRVINSQCQGDFDVVRFIGAQRGTELIGRDIPVLTFLFEELLKRLHANEEADKVEGDRR